MGDLEKRNARRRELYAQDAEHRAKRRAQAEKWKAENRESYLAQQAEKRRAQYASAEGKERMDAAKRRWMERNPGKQEEAYYAWYAKFGAAYHRKWAAAKRVSDPELFIWRNARNRAKEKGLAFSIALEDIVIPEFCPVLGIKIEKGSGPFLPSSPSIDRFDPTKGYVPGNIFIISNRANIIKRDCTIEEVRALLVWMERIGAKSQ
jgi:hypothetical protein